jgi:hypothetical protein
MLLYTIVKITFAVFVIIFGFYCLYLSVKKQVKNNSVFDFLLILIANKFNLLILVIGFTILLILNEAQILTSLFAFVIFLYHYLKYQ